MRREQPLVSIIVPVFNVERYLTDCLDSILQQTYQNIEIVCVDDGSTDKSVQILREYIKKNNRIKLIQHDRNRGLSEARNTGMKHIKGKYLLFVDSDDLILSETVMKLVEYSEKKDTDLVLFENVKFCEKKELLSVEIQDIEEPKVCSGKEQFRILQENRKYQGTVTNCLFRTEFIKQNNIRFIEDILFEDLPFMFQSLMQAERVICVPYKLYLYRKREGSIMAELLGTEMDIKSYFVLMIKIFQIWQNTDLNDNQNGSVSNYFKKLYVRYRNMCQYSTRRAYGDLEIKNKAMRSLFDIIEHHNQLCYLELSDEHIKCLKQYREVYVYGAGNASLDIIKRLEREQIKVKSIIVTQKDKDSDKILGYKIVNISEIQFKPDEAVVILATTAKYWDDMKKMAKKTGFKNILQPIDSGW